MVMFAIGSSANSEQIHEINGFRLGVTADEIERGAPQDCWEQEVYYFCDAGSFMVLYTPGGLSWTITFAWEYSGPLEPVAERLGAEYQVKLAPDPTVEAYAGSADGLRVKLARNGRDTRLTITDTALAPVLPMTHADHEAPSE
jgi:hypothetical protein